MRLVVFGTLFALGCGADAPEAPATPAAEAPAAEAAAPAAAPAAPAALSEAQLSALAAADAADGATDKVVSQCNSCALHMEGDTTYTTQTGDYELHFCSSSCQEAYEADPAKGLEQMAENAKQL